MKKIIALTIAAALALSALTGALVMALSARRRSEKNKE